MLRRESGKQTPYPGPLLFIREGPIILLLPPTTTIQTLLGTLAVPPRNMALAC